MLRSLKHIVGYDLHAEDGDVGSIRDALFDDRSWQLRYFVIDTGKWLPGRKVVIPPTELGEPDWVDQRVPTRLTRAQVKDSPPLESHQPVSAQQEQEVHRYFGWQPYWGVQSMPLGQRAVVPAPVWVRQPALSGVEPRTGGKRPDVAKATAGNDLAAQAKADEASRQDATLRSLREVEGYAIQATDDDLGAVEDAIVETADWSIAYLVVDTRRWLPGRRVLIAPDRIDAISWPDRKVFVTMTRDEVKSSPKYDPNEPINEDYRNQLHDYYGRPVDEISARRR